MMLHKTLLLSIVFFFGLFSENNETKEAETQQILLGYFQKEDLMQRPHSAWFNPGYKHYKPKSRALKTIQENINEYEIKLIMGTWCADSQYEVPKFYKLLDITGFDQKKLQAYAVDEYKIAGDEVADSYEVELVPTILFYKDGKEVNRFVEYAVDNLEEDIAKIVSGKKYEHSYFGF
jgi:thiol-disulfide isomerase/thioredoxin